jgi:AcrR family transcriptional regulator
MSTRIARAGKTMRKEPQQARSRATVDAIVTAGTQVLGQSGWAEFTTNQVAAAAGVSIGSLYQYFPNKLALIGAIRRRHFDEVLAIVQGVNMNARSLEGSVEVLVDGMLAVHGSHPALHRALLEEVPRVEEASSAHDGFEQQYLRHFRNFISKHRTSSGSNEVAAQVLSTAVEGVVHHAALSGLLKSSELKRELAALIRAYVRS